MDNLKREEVLKFLKLARPEFTEQDWGNADLITVLSWAIPTYQTWEKNGLLKQEESV
jgi:hypothetical protein